MVTIPDEVDRLRAAIRKHRDQRGDDRCFLDDIELYLVLPEGDTRPRQETEVTIENCQRFIECRQKGREYISPQRKIEELEAAVKDLRNMLTWLNNNGGLGSDVHRRIDSVLVRYPKEIKP